MLGIGPLRKIFPVTKFKHFPGYAGSGLRHTQFGTTTKSPHEGSLGNMGVPPRVYTHQWTVVDTTVDPEPLHAFVSDGEET